MTDKKNSNNLVALLLIPVLIVGLAILAYNYLITPMLKQKKELSDKKYELQVRKIELQNLKTHEEEFKDEIEKARATVNKSLNKFSGGNSPEKSIIFSTRFEEDAEFSAFIDSLTFNPKELVTSMNLPMVTETEDGGYSISYSDIELYKEKLVMSFKAEYANLKNIMAYISAYHERMNISGAEISYNEEDGDLTGTITINQYSVVGGENQYKMDDIFGIRNGKENLFTN